MTDFVHPILDTIGDPIISKQDIATPYGTGNPVIVEQVGSQAVITQMENADCVYIMADQVEYVIEALLNIQIDNNREPGVAPDAIG